MIHFKDDAFFYFFDFGDFEHDIINFENLREYSGARIGDSWDNRKET